jgi:Icc protein
MKIHPQYVKQSNPLQLSVIQFTDTHIHSGSKTLLHGIDSSETLKSIVRHINELETPDVILLTGDLVEIPDEESYLKLRAILTELKAPVFCLPGNHDCPALMYRLMNYENIKTDKLIRGEDWQLILLNSMMPGEMYGYLDKAETVFLEKAIQDFNDGYSLVALHHHPVKVNSPWMDTMVLENADNFFQILESGHNVKIVICGHIHNELELCINDILILGTPSTNIQYTLDSQQPEYDTKLPAYRRITLGASGLIDSNITWIG